jgi:DnaJ-domain-containing protein 1
MDDWLKDHYTVLGLDRAPTLAAIHEAYRRLAKQYHPDRAGEGATAQFREIQEAYEVLSDPVKKQRYDSSMEKRRPHHNSVREVLRASPSRRYVAAPEPLIPHPRVEPLIEPLSRHSGPMAWTTAQGYRVVIVILEEDHPFKDRFI